MKGFTKTFELLNKLAESKNSLVESLTKQNVEASFDDSIYDLMAKAEMSDTIILVDEAGNEIVGVITEEEVDFTATENDIREGKVAATNKGITTGTKVIPSYHTTEGYAAIPAGKAISFVIRDAKLFDYTKLQAIICSFDASLAKSVSAEKVAINNKVYEVLTNTAIAEVTKDVDTQTINFGITNTGEKPCVIRYFTYKEIY